MMCVHLAGSLPSVLTRQAPDASLKAALHQLVGRGATLLLANAAGSQEVADPEFVHQARVAVRRMRSAARALGRDAGWPASLDDELRWIARLLGAVRDWDVLQAQTLPALDEVSPGRFSACIRKDLLITAAP